MKLFQHIANSYLYMLKFREIVVKVARKSYFNVF